MQARIDTIDLAIHRTIHYRNKLEARIQATTKETYYTKESPRRIDVRRENEILDMLQTLRNQS